MMTRQRAWIPICSTIVALTGVMFAGPRLAAEREGAKTATYIIAGPPYASAGELWQARVPATTIEKLAPLVTIRAAASFDQEPAKTKKARTKGAKGQKKEPRPAASTGVASDITYTGPQGPSQAGPATSTGAGPILDVTHTGPRGK